MTASAGPIPPGAAARASSGPGSTACPEKRLAQIPAGLVFPAPVLEVIDGDAVSHCGLGEPTGGRASDAAVRDALLHARTASLALSGGDSARITTVIAGSTVTATHHLAVVTEFPANSWRFCRGLDGADQALIAELEMLVDRVSSRRARSSERLPKAVLLVGADHAYAPVIRQLRLLGVPTWVLQPGRYIAAELYKAACAVTPLTSPLAA